MNSSQSSYRSILKGTAIFGGVQVFNILINLIRGKFVALLLGPTGMGISSLLSSTITPIQQFSSFGLQLPAVRNISRAYEKEDAHELAVNIRLYRKLLKVTGIFGAILCCLFSGILSRLVFGDNSQTWSFVFLSLAILFMTQTNGEAAILQGVRHLKRLALATLVGSLVGLLFGVPLYYFFGVNGIVPAIILLSICTYIFNRHNGSKIKIVKTTITRSDFLNRSKSMISLGAVSVLAMFIGSVTNLLINIFIRNFGSISDVGLFQASTSITNQYVGLVFSAMAVDYFPRLAAIVENKKKMRLTVNLQSEIVLLIVVPLVLLIIITAPILIHLLLSDEFLTIIPLLRWMALGLIFKAAAYPMGYIPFSKGDKKTFFWLEGICGNVLMLSINILCYFFWGLLGLGISFLITYILIYIVYIYITKVKYNFVYNKGFLSLFIKLLFGGLLVFLFSFMELKLFLLLEILTFCIITAFAFGELNKRLDIKSLIFKKR